MKICGLCGEIGEKSGTHIDKANPNRTIMLDRHICVNPDCIDCKRWIGDDNIREIK